MPRKARQKSGTGFYHVIARGLDKEPVFQTGAEKRRMREIIRENLEKYQVSVYAYCLMSNHIHLLVKADLKNLSLFMAKILAKYAHYYNYKHHRTGYVFQGRFRSQCIESEAYFWNCLRYVHLNPVKANLCKRPASYPYSSMTEYMDVKKQLLLDAKGREMFRSRFYRWKEFEEFHRASCGDFFIDIREEEFAQRKAIAEEILRQLQEEKGLSAEEILDQVEMRDFFEKNLRETFGISKDKIRKIREAIEGELIRKEK